MANTNNGNTWFIDTKVGGAGYTDPSGKPMVIMFAIISANATGAGRALLVDPSSGASKIEMRCPTNDSRFYPLADSPIVCPNGIQVSQLDNCTVTLVGRITGA